MALLSIWVLIFLTCSICFTFGARRPFCQTYATRGSAVCFLRLRLTEFTIAKNSASLSNSTPLSQYCPVFRSISRSISSRSSWVVSIPSLRSHSLTLMLTFALPCLQGAECVHFGQLPIQSHPRTRKNCIRLDVNAAGMLRHQVGWHICKGRRGNWERHVCRKSSLKEAW